MTPRRRWGLIVWLVLAWCWNLSQLLPASPHPHLKFDPPAVEFGSVWQQEKLEAAVEVTLISPLELLKVEPTCGCTEASVSSSHPGSARIAIRFSTDLMRGPVEKWVLLHLNDGSVARLPLRAVIRPLMRSQPEVVQLGSQAVSVQLLPARPDIVPVQLSTNAGGLRLSELDQHSRFTVEAEAPEKGLTGHILVETSSPALPTFYIPVTGR